MSAYRIKVVGYWARLTQASVGVAQRLDGHTQASSNMPGSRSVYLASYVNYAAAYESFALPLQHFKTL